MDVSFVDMTKPIELSIQTNAARPMEKRFNNHSTLSRLPGSLRQDKTLPPFFRGCRVRPGMTPVFQCCYHL